MDRTRDALRAHDERVEEDPAEKEPDEPGSERRDEDDDEDERG
jgi:hypothetical protein